MIGWPSQFGATTEFFIRQCLWIVAVANAKLHGPNDMSLISPSHLEEKRISKRRKIMKKRRHNACDNRAAAG
jgi:hypothetical protein